MARRKRTLSGDERSLWELVTRSAEALHPEPPAPPAPADERPPGPPPPPRPLPKKRAAVAPPMPPPAAAPRPAGLGPLDRKTRTRLSRGSLEIELRLDLHGMTQTAAHVRLRHFLEGAQGDGARLVLVITGKGKAEDGTRAEERGVLRRVVPVWLESTAFRHFVAGFDEAGRRHGGGGAIYVRVRKPKS